MNDYDQLHQLLREITVNRHIEKIKADRNGFYERNIHQIRNHLKKEICNPILTEHKE